MVIASLLLLQLDLSGRVGGAGWGGWGGEVLVVELRESLVLASSLAQAISRSKSTRRATAGVMSPVTPKKMQLSASGSCLAWLLSFKHLGHGFWSPLARLGSATPVVV